MVKGPIDVYDEKHRSDWHCATTLVHVQFTWGTLYYFSISKTFCVAASMSPDNFHSSAMHFSWHLQPCAITKKASTSLEWHLGPEWDVLYQHYAARMETNIYSSFMEMLRKHRVGVRHKYYFYFFLFYRCSTWRVLWDFRFKLSVIFKAGFFLLMFFGFFTANS